MKPSPTPHRPLPCLTRWISWWENEATACPVANGSESPWPEPSCETRNSCYWTNRPRALDADNEALVLSATQRLIAGRTALLVAHRPSLLPLATRVIEVKHGHIREVVAA